MVNKPLTPAQVKKAEKALDKAVSECYKKHANDVQFDIFDLSKISNEVKAAVKNNEDMDTAMQAAVAKYRKN